MRITTSTIPSSNLNRRVAKKNGNTQDIIASILRMDKKQAGDFCQFAQQFDDGERGLKTLHRWLRQEIYYEADQEQQIIKAPAALYAMGQGDCKSLTLFVNKVLQCLGIPYIIRFTTPNADVKEVKHVYTVALYNGRQIPIDAVYHRFGQEASYYKNIDYQPDMTEIIEISGLSFNQASNKNKRTKLVNNCAPTQLPQTKESIQKQAEINQKKKDVVKVDPPQFHKITEGQAMLEIALQELHTMRAMQPEKAEIAQDGINRIVKALNGNTLGALSGVIPCELYGLANKIKVADKLDMAANSFGYNANQLEQMLIKKANEEQGDRETEKWSEELEQMYNKGSRVGQIQFPDRVCLNGLWFMEGAPYTYQQLMGFEGWDYPANPGRCGAADPLSMVNQTIPGTYPPQPMFPLYYGYGRDSEYRVTNAEYAQGFMDTLNAMDGDLVHGIGGNGGGPVSVWVNSQLDWNAMLDIFNQNSGATTKYINDIYDPTAQNGTMGSGLYYTFADGITTQGGSTVHQNQLPNVVTTKKAFQDQFNESVKIFTGVSPQNIKGMARNGVIFDTGEHPEASLNDLYSLFITPTDAINGFKYIHGIGYVPVVEIIAAIAVAIGTIIGALASAGVFSDKAQTQAPLLDQSASDNAQWRPLTPSTLASGDDWIGGPGGGGGGTGGVLTDNKGLLLGGAAVLVYAALRKKK